MTAGQLVWAARNEWHGFRNTGTVPLQACTQQAQAF